MKYLAALCLLAICSGELYGPPDFVPGPAIGPGGSGNGLAGALVELISNGNTGSHTSHGSNSIGQGALVRLVSNNGVNAGSSFQGDASGFNGQGSGFSNGNFGGAQNGRGGVTNGGASGSFNGAGLGGGSGDSVRTIVTKDIYLHAPAPESPEEFAADLAGVNQNRKHYKIIFIKAPSVSIEQQLQIQQEANREEKTIVYVLVKKPDINTEIEDARRSLARKNKPEVFFIKYKTNKNQAAGNGGSGGNEGFNGGLFELVGAQNDAVGNGGAAAGLNLGNLGTNGAVGGAGSGSLFQLVGAGNGHGSSGSTYNSPPVEASHGGSYTKK